MFDFCPFWIWPRDLERPFNRFARFRRRFHVASATSALLNITADARYELWLDGERLGSGPPRSWPDLWPVDQYELQLAPGEHVLAVRVHHFGIGTFQYLPAEAGLLLELRAQNSEILKSDASWRASEDARFAWPVPRISCQQGWEEQFDARFELGPEFDDWTALDFDDSKWPFARETRRAGVGDHPQFEARTVPQWTDEALEPQLLNAEIVQTAPHTISLLPRELFNNQDWSADLLLGHALVALEVHSQREQSAQFHQPHHALQWKLNGAELDFSDLSRQPTDAGVAHAPLRAGRNLLLGRLPTMAHEWAPLLSIWAKDLEIGTPKFIGPFPLDETIKRPKERPRYIEASHFAPNATADDWERVWQSGEWTVEWERAFPSELAPRVDVFGVCTSERVTNETARVEVSGDGWTISPAQNGDVRLLFDWGDEVVGPLEWEIEAPDGTVLDWHFFEFIQNDGRVNLCEGMNNTLRYICREGRQHHRSHGRRGFRFAWLSIRNFYKPITLRRVRAILATTPPSERGHFECSDPLLNQIWQVGARTTRLCTEDTYTDCPSYEQTFWVGDGRVESLVDLSVNGDPRVSMRSWRVAARSLERSALVEGEVPSAWRVVLPAWTFLWMRWARELWQWSGDYEFGFEALHWLERNNETIARHRNARGLFAFEAWNLFDWAPLDTPADGAVTHVNCLAVQGLRESAQLARDLNEKATARTWDDLADSLAHAVNAHLWDEAKGAYADCRRADGTLSPVFSRQTQTAAFLSGVADAPFGNAKRAQRCRAILEAPPADFVDAGSPFFMCFVLEALEKENRAHELLDQIRSYWGRQIEAGATTFWETYFPPSHLQHGAGQINGASLHRLTRSHCHGWSAAPTHYLSSVVLGAQPLEAGWKKVCVAPQTGDLKWAKGRVPTPHGDIEIEWRKEADGELKLVVRAPQNVEIVTPHPR